MWVQIYLQLKILKTHRLSAEMGTKVSADESSLENINIKDRPMTIASEYELICSNQWLSAKMELDLQDDLEEEDKLNFLRNIFLVRNFMIFCASAKMLECYFS